jgi:hypothetical protein
LASCAEGPQWAGLTSWIVDLRPYGKRKYFSSKDAALGEAQIQRIRLRKEGLEGFEFTLDQRTDALAALTVLAGSGLSLTDAAKIAVEFHGIRTSGISLKEAVAALLNTKGKKSDRYQKDLRLKWPQDVLRHSFASYRYAACGDENLTRKEMGHYGSVHTFLRHYKNRVRDEDAKEFWAIVPDAQ